MSPGGEFNDAGNYFHWADQKHPSFTSPFCSENTNRETAAICTGVTENTIIKETGRVNNPIKWWGCTEPPRYHVASLHTYWNWTNNMDPDVAERAEQSIKEYTKQNSAMGGNRGYKGIQYGRGQTSSTTKSSMFEESRDQIYQFCN